MKSQVLKTLIDVIMNVTPLFVSIILFGIYAWKDGKLTPSKAYMILSLFNLLLIPLRMIVMVLLAYFNAVVSMDRIEMFLNTEER